MLNKEQIEKFENEFRDLWVDEVEEIDFEELLEKGYEDKLKETLSQFHYVDEYYHEDKIMNCENLKGRVLDFGVDEYLNDESEYDTLEKQEMYRNNIKEYITTYIENEVYYTIHRDDEFNEWLETDDENDYVNLCNEALELSKKMCPSFNEESNIKFIDISYITRCKNRDTKWKDLVVITSYKFIDEYIKHLETL